MSCVDFFLCDVRWSTGREELGSVQLSEHALQAHLGPQHPASLLRCPWGPSAPAVATVLMRTAEICFPVSELHTGRYVYTAHAQCILWFFYSVSCLQSVFRECRSVSMYCLCQCFCFPCCRLSLSDWVTVYLPIFFKYIWIISNIFLNKLCFYWKKVKWKHFSQSHWKRLAPAYLSKM